MITRRWGLVVSGTVALLLLFQAQVLFAQGVAERVKPELERAWAFGRAKQYDQQLAIYDKLLADAEVKKDRISGLIKRMAVEAAAAAKRKDEVIRRA
ncbi:MAG: hypothetical protein AMS16_03295, partial [Planctomycetes bacterium DG_58]